MLSYTAHPDLEEFLLVKGDEEKYKVLMECVDGEWTNDGAGWIVSVDHEDHLARMVASEAQVNAFEKNKRSHGRQRRFGRSRSRNKQHNNNNEAPEHESDPEENPGEFFQEPENNEPAEYQDIPDDLKNRYKYLLRKPPRNSS